MAQQIIDINIWDFIRGILQTWWWMLKTFWQLWLLLVILLIVRIIGFKYLKKWIKKRRSQ